MIAAIERSSLFRVALYYTLLGAVIVLLWCAYYRKWPGDGGFGVPVLYAGDAQCTMGVAKGFSEFPLPWDIRVQKLDAPFGAVWNDYPLPDKLQWYYTGALARLFEIGVAANLALLTAHITAAFGFAWAARRFSGSFLISFIGAILYSFSPYMLGRGLEHLALTFTWHLPVWMYIIANSGASTAERSLRAWLGVGLLVAATSLQSPYYALIVFQLLFICGLRALLLRNKRNAAYFGGILALGCSVFALSQINVFMQTAREGANPLAASRDLPSLVTWGLRLPDLFLPRFHPISPWAEFGQKHYFSNGALINENQLAFLGVVGVICFVGLLASALLNGLRGRWRSVPAEAWISGYVLFFALVGGINYLLGSMGFVWLRGANRYSILLLCLALIWGVRSLTFHFSRALRLALAIGMGGVGLWEVYASRPEWFFREQDAVAIRVHSDRIFSNKLQSALPDRAAIFEFPIMPFPESPAIAGLSDYELFRPILWTSQLRFSYGGHKGRARGRWQTALESLPDEAKASFLGQHGFDAVIVFRRGYADGAASLVGALVAGGATQIAESPIGDLVAFRIRKTAALRPVVPPSMELADHWWGWEGTGADRWSWAKGSSSLLLLAEPNLHRPLTIEFGLEVLQSQTIRITLDDRLVRELQVAPQQPVQVRLLWTPARTTTYMRFSTDAIAQLPGNGDIRPLCFRLVRPTMRFEEPEPKR